MRIALNGCGRIGKNFIRALLHAGRERELVAINIGSKDPRMIAYTLRYDSILGTYSGNMSYKDGKLWINNHGIAVYQQLSATSLPWRNLAIDWVVDASGHYTTREKAQEHLNAGAHAILITAPMTGDDITIILGVNEHQFSAAQHRVVSLGSCTTNAVMPLVATLEPHIDITAISMTTAHAYTNSQALLDGIASPDDPRRSRAAALNIVPSTTGALEVLQHMMPQFKGKVVGHALRVPVPNVSIIDLVVMTKNTLDTNTLHDIFEQAAQQHPHIIATTREPLVSSDFKGATHSVTVDLGLTTAGNHFCKVFGWYDNEYGYSTRVCDFLKFTHVS